MNNKIASSKWPKPTTKTLKPKPFAQGRESRLSQSLAGRERQKLSRVFRYGSPDFESNFELGKPKEVKNPWRIGQ